jgi:hypothetical protein
LNRLAIVDSLKAQGSNAQERDVEPSSEDKVVVHKLQIEDTQEDSNVITIPEDTGGQVKSLQLEQSRLIPLSKGNRLRILFWSMSVKMGRRRRMLIKLMEVKVMTS